MHLNDLKRRNGSYFAICVILPNLVAFDPITYNSGWRYTDIFRDRIVAKESSFSDISLMANSQGGGVTPARALKWSIPVASENLNNNQP